MTFNQTFIKTECKRQKCVIVNTKLKLKIISNHHQICDTKLIIDKGILRTHENEIVQPLSDAIFA